MYVGRFMGDFGASSYFQYTELLCDSTDATISNDANFDADDWPRFYFTSKQPNIAAIKVLQAEIPFVFDTINNSNNTLIYLDTGISYTITVPTGNYNQTTLAGYLQTEISAIRGGFTVTYDTTTRKFTFMTAAAISWGLNFVGRKNLHAVLGFKFDFLYTASGAGSSIVSGSASLTGGNYIHINSQTIGPYIECNTTDYSDGGGITPVICRLPLNAAPDELIRYTDPSPTMWFDYIGNQFETFDLYLTLNTISPQIPLDMKGINWSVKIGVLTYREGAIQKGAPVIGKTL